MASQPPQHQRRQSAPVSGFGRVSALRASSTLQSIPELGTIAPRRPTTSNIGSNVSRSFSGPVGGSIPSKPGKTVATPPAKSAQRTTKISQKLVVLPSEPQTAPLPEELRPGRGDADDEGPPRASGPLPYPKHHDHRSEGERMTKEERQRAGYRRLTAYCVAEGFRLKLLLAYLKREHGVSPRVFDEAVYSLYHLPLLPGYGPNVNIRSSAVPRSPTGGSILSQLSEAEDLGYDGTYFATSTSPEQQYLLDGYISGSPPVQRKIRRVESSDAEPFLESETEVEPVGAFAESTEGVGFAIPITAPPPERPRRPTKKKPKNEGDDIAEMVVFDYGVAVFFGFEEAQERAVLEDFDRAMICVRPRPEEKWEVETCHYVYDPAASSPRIYNDFFTFKSHSHLLKISLSHALGQSVLLGHYESLTQAVLSSGQTLTIPKQLATTGELKLGRSEALRLTGRLFKLRRDVNLVSNVLDTPELFWSEASLKELYQACREYFEIDDRVEVLNQKLGVTSELLDMIHDHLNNNAMIRITWIIIWLIVAACLVELGEVIARLIVGASKANRIRQTISPEEALRVLNLMSS
ncbi:hypothetical protein FRC01_000495 [Tulasnella sp. 417]|nr:hypothetical protein FRC01_000495 [Tulasnella sp. 417]